MATRFTLKDFEQADSELREEQSRKHFYYHTLAYVMTNLVLVVLNLLLDPAFPWAIIPIITWGIALVAHYIVAFRRIKSANARWMAKAEYLAEELHRANEFLPEQTA